MDADIIHQIKKKRFEADALPVPKKANLLKSINACISNGERLLSDAMMLEFENPASTKLFLSMIAQEEFSKAFLIFMVHEGALPWSKSLIRAMNDHTCKQLVGIIIEYLDRLRHWETLEELEELISKEVELGDRMPTEVATAFNILRHEKIGSWIGENFSFYDDEEYEGSTIKVAKGKKDRFKQSALYVSIGRDGRVSGCPTKIESNLPDGEFERAESYKYVISSLVSGSIPRPEEYAKVRRAFALLFEAFFDIEESAGR